MIPKITTNHKVPFLFPSHIITQILRYSLIKVSKLLVYIDYESSTLINISIIIKPGKVTVKYDDNPEHVLNSKITKVQILCSQEWLQLLYVLNDTPDTVKRLILQTLTIFPTKLLLIIHVLMTMSHADINLLLLKTFFDPKCFSYSYTIHTYVNIGTSTRTLLCYSKFCGYEYNPYDMSKYLIQYFDKTHNMHTQLEERPMARSLCYNDDWLIDQDMNYYVVTMTYHPKMTYICQIKDSRVSLFVYAVNENEYNLQRTSTLDSMNNQIIILCGSTSTLSAFIAKIKFTTHLTPTISLHHILVDNKLC